MTLPKAGIFGFAGTSLTDEEKRFFAGLNPLGFILFARNCESPAQLKQLTHDLRALLGRKDLLILIDQEGGRVSRLKPPHWRKVPPAGAFAEIAFQSIADGRRATHMNARLIARELHALGINVNCAPLADVPVPGAHDIIGDRAFGDDPYQVTVLAEAFARGLMDGGVLPVVKHIPGHGRAGADSHEELPRVSEPLYGLRRSDFIPFRALAHLPLGMTAHILYTDIDAQLPATLSPKVIRLIREEINFDGLLMSDDLSMKALSGSLEELTTKTILAGCDIVLHCNGKMEEMQRVAAALPPLDSKAERRFARALTMLKPPSEYEYEEAERYLSKAIRA